MDGSLEATVQSFAVAGRLQEAWSLLQARAREADPVALFHIATWLLTGEHVPRDLARARRILREAARLGHADAMLFEIALSGNGSGEPEDWCGAVTMLRAAAARHETAAAYWALLARMDLTKDGAPRSLPRAENLALDGTVVRLPSLLTRDECAHVAHAAADLLVPTVVVDPNTGRQVPHPIRTSDGAVIGPTRETLPIQAINRRIATASGTDWRQGEALTILRYSPGQQYRAHFDTLSDTTNQRTQTVVVYLNEGFEGGETTFPHHNIIVRPRMGDALIFTNTLPDGSGDPRALHTGQPVLAGVKWLATRWIRERPFSPWKGPEIAI